MSEKPTAAEAIENTQVAQANPEIMSGTLPERGSLIDRFPPGDSSYYAHAWREFMVAGWCDEKGVFEHPMQQLICDNVLSLLEVLCGQDHSGSSYPYLMGLFEAVSGFHPITPLTGEPDEWYEIGNGQYQNKRCSEVFMSGGIAYRTGGIVFRNKEGHTFQNSKSRVYIDFPWRYCPPEVRDEEPEEGA